MVFTKLTTFLALTAFAAVSMADASSSALPRVHTGVYRSLRKQGAVNLIVTMKDSPQSTLESVQEAVFATRGQKIASLVERLESFSQASQASISALLSQETASATPLYAKQETYWITNQVYFEDATFELVEKLSALLSISEIREEQRLQRWKPIVPSSSVANSTSETTDRRHLATATPEWGLTKIQAPAVWASGNMGQSVVVSSIDGGVLASHETLKGNFRSSFSWFDPEKKTAIPYDVDDHSTHTMDYPESDLLTCAQFITCPTDVTGKIKYCSKAPHVVSNSWGGGQGDTFYQAVVDTWLAAGIIPIFANGNEGPKCSTSSSPGDYARVIAVGATDINDGLASFSSKGPSVNKVLKPDVSAPGDEVRSAWGTGNSDYGTISGTSMATPHVSGIVALMLNANPALSFADIKRTLTSTVDTATPSLRSTPAAAPRMAPSRTTTLATAAFNPSANHEGSNPSAYHCDPIELCGARCLSMPGLGRLHLDLVDRHVQLELEVD